jgi:hypothetical protein
MLTMCKWEMLVIKYTHSEAGPYNTKSCVSWLVTNTPEIEVK